MLDYVKKPLFSKTIKFGDITKTIEFYTYPKYSISNNSQVFEIYYKNLQYMPKRLKDNGYTTWYELYDEDNYCIFFEYNGDEFAFDADLNVFVVNNFLHKGGVDISLLGTGYIFKDNEYSVFEFRDIIWNVIYGVSEAKPIFEYIYINIFDFFPHLIRTPISALIAATRKLKAQNSLKIFELYNLKKSIEFNVRLDGDYVKMSFRNAILIEYNEILYLVDAICNFYKIVYYPLGDIAFLEYGGLDYEEEEKIIKEIEKTIKKNVKMVTIEGIDEDDNIHYSDKYYANVSCFLSYLTDECNLIFYDLELKRILTNKFILLDDEKNILFTSKTYAETEGKKKRYCPNCHSEVGIDNWCDECLEFVEPYRAYAENHNKNVEKKQCPICGSKLDEDNWCDECNEFIDLDEFEEENDNISYCPNCGNELDEDHWCSSCLEFFDEDLEDNEDYDDDCDDEDLEDTDSYKDDIHIIGVRFATQTRGCYYYRCKKPEYKVGDTLFVPTQYGNKEARVVFVRTYKDKNEVLQDTKYSLDILKWAPEKKTLSQEELKKIEQERLAKEKAEKERLERERQERIRKEEENKKRILEEKTKIRNELISLKNKYKKESYSSINFQTITNLISNFEKKLDSEKYLSHKQDYNLLIIAVKEVKTLEQEEADRKRKKKITIITSTIVAIVLLLIFVNNVIVPNAKYSNAINLIENGKYEEAEDVFYDLGDYKEAEIYIKLIDVKKQCDRKEYTKAISTLESIGGSSKFDVDYNGGSKSDSYINLYGKRIDSSERTGYTFKEYLTNSFSLDVKNKQLIIKLKATYTINQYSITYYLNGGTLFENNPTGYNVDTDTFVLNEPTRTGYEFLGWTYSGNSTPAKNVKISKGTTGNLTFTANWKANSYSVSFNSDGGNSFNDLSVTYDSNYSLPTPSKTGYSFSGWYNGNNLVPSNGTWKYTYNLNLVAKWSINSYSITYYLNGGKADNPTSYNVNTSTFTLNNPEKTGYKFVGWSTSANGTKNMNVTIEKGSTGAKTYYANWEVVTYNINYYLDSGTNNLSNPKTYTIEDFIQLKDPAKTGYTFEGWYSDSDFQTKVITVSKGTFGNLDLYAKFVANSYKITVNASSFNVSFMMNDGTSNMYKTQTITTSQGLEYPSIPERSGYVFTGWYTEEECLNHYNFKDAVLMDLSLYAGWVESGGYRAIYGSSSGYASGNIVALTDGAITVSMGSETRYYRDWSVIRVNDGATLYTCSTNWFNNGYVKIKVKAGDVIRVTSGSWYIIATGSFANSAPALPEAGGRAFNTEQNIIVVYDSSYKLSVRTIEGYKFIGYFDVNGVQYTDEYGNSLLNYNNEGNITLYEKWQKTS